MVLGVAQVALEDAVDWVGPTAAVLAVEGDGAGLGEMAAGEVLEASQVAAMGVVVALVAARGTQRGGREHIYPCR